MTSTEPLRLSILDFGARRHRAPSRLAVVETVRAAQLAEALGYHRYWLAEHHAFDDVWGAAAPMVAHLAASTRRIKLGTAGTLVAFHDPYDTAQDYRLLAALHPGRIDLGIAGGQPSHEGLRDRHLARDDFRARYLRHVDELIRFARMRPTDPGVAESRLMPVPADVTVPVPWMLGTGGGSKELALRYGTAYCCSLFHGPAPAPEVVRDYLARFVPNEHCAEPTAAIAVGVVCAETEDEAREIVERQRGDFAARLIRANVVGSPRQCAEQLARHADAYGVRELVVYDLSCTVPERRRCYELLAAELLAAASARDAAAESVSMPACALAQQGLAASRVERVAAERV